MTSRRGVRQFIKFGLVGSTGFTMNLIVFTLLQKVVPGHARPLEYNIIYTVAFLAGGVSNYYLNRIWTFRSTRNIVREGAQFLSVSTVALAVGLLVSAAVSPWFGHGHKTWFVANVSGIFINFFLNKYWTFKHVN
ncbi:MAG: GtrA family protein [Candidatus Tumulicola sp.]